jgi:hypothetical protein
MTIEEILKLGEMGYTKDEIEAMGTEKTVEPEPVKEPEPEPVKEPEPAKAPEQDMLKFIAGEFEKLNKSIQLANINNSNINQPKEKTAEEVLADLIAPPLKGGKTK